MPGMYRVERMAGKWRVFEGETLLEGEYTSKDAAQNAVNTMAQAAFKGSAPLPKGGAPVDTATVP